LITGVLSKTTPKTTRSGAPGKAKYEIADGIADSTHRAASELLSHHQLYPGLEL
jgi:glycine hydroxymethyltransferase